jgi:ribonuclease P protein component
LLVTGDRSLSNRSQPASVQSDSAQPVSDKPVFDQHYARDRRIVKTDEFSSVFRLRPTYRTAHFVLYTRNNGLAQARLGIVVAKRLASRAITRNMIKRVTRELFRQTALPATDCVVRLSKPINSRTDPATSAQLKKHLRNELQQLFSSLRRQDLPQ